MKCERCEKEADYVISYEGRVIEGQRENYSCDNCLSYFILRNNMINMGAIASNVAVKCTIQQITPHDFTERRLNYE
jgi:hypothetical protein